MKRLLAGLYSASLSLLLAVQPAIAAAPAILASAPKIPGGSRGAVQCNGGNAQFSACTSGTNYAAPTRVPPFAQAPPVTADTNHGYAASNFWLERSPNLVPSPGNLFQAQGVSVGQAEWPNVYYNPQPFLADALGTGTVPLAAYGTVLLVSSYAGSAFEVTRASDSTTYDAGFVQGPNGLKVADVAGVAKFCVNTTCMIDKWFDQSGNGYNATQATGTNQPAFVTRLMNGIPVIYSESDPSSSSPGTWLNMPSGVSVNTQAVSMVAVGEWYWSSGTQLFGVGTSLSSSLGLLTGNGTVGQGFDAYSNSSHTLSNLIPQNDAPQFLAITSSALARNIYQNDQSVSLSATTSATATGGQIGTFANESYGARGDYVAFLVYGSSLSSAQITTLKQVAYTSFGVIPQFDTHLGLLGDSITAGSTTTANGLDRVAQMMPLLGENLPTYNIGIPGETCATMVASYSSQGAAIYVPGKTNIALLLCGTNDISAGTTASTIYGYISTLVADLRTTGFSKVIVGTVLPASSWNSTQQSVWSALNSLIRANTAGADTISDFQNDPLMGPFAAASSATYYSGGLHPTDLGQGIMANILESIVSSYLPRQ